MEELDLKTLTPGDVFCLVTNNTEWWFAVTNLTEVSHSNYIKNLFLSRNPLSASSDDEHTSHSHTTAIALTDLIIEVGAAIAVYPNTGSAMLTGAVKEIRLNA